MDPITTSAIIATGGGILNNQITGAQNYNRTRNLMGIQLQNQQQLNAQQFRFQQMLNEQGMQQQMEMWKNTNYPAQVQMLKSAGLNPALLYGKGGAGGATTGSQTGGSAQGGTAGMGMAPPPNYMDVASLAKISAEIALLKAQAKKTLVDADFTSGVETQEKKTNIQLLLASVTNTDARTALTNAQTTAQNIENDINNATKETRVSTAREQLALYTEQVKKAITENGIIAGQADALIQQETEKVAIQLIQKRLMESQIGQNKAQTDALVAGIKQRWAEIANTSRSLDLKQIDQKQDLMRIQQKGEEIELAGKRLTMDQMQNAVKQKLMEWQMLHPNVSQALGGVMEDLKGFFNGDPRIWK